MKQAKRSLVLMVVLLIFLATAIAAAGFVSYTPTPDSKYRVFCANNKIEVEQRTLEHQKNARGSNVCVLGQFDYLSDAEKFAESKGGKGADCNCS
jgi:uncharacterized membrane protein